MPADEKTKVLKTAQGTTGMDAKYSHFMDIISDGVILIDQYGNCLSANDVISKFFSVEKEAIVGRPSYEVFQDIGIPELSHVINEIGDDDRSLSTVQCLDQPNRDILWFGIKGYELDDGIILIFSDITKRIEAETSLKASEERYRLLVDNTNEGIAVIQNGHFKFFNNKLCEILNYSPKDFEDLDFWDIIHPDFFQAVKSAYLGTFQGTALKDNLEFKAVSRFGSTRWLYANLVAIDWEDSLAVLAFLSDITARKKAKQALYESEQRYRRLVDNAPDMIIRMGLPNGEYQYVSPSTETITGYKPEDFHNNPLLIRDVIHPDWREYFENSWKEILKGNVQPRYEYQAIAKSGETRWYSQSNFLIKDDSGQPVALEAIVRDITDYRLTQIALQAAREDLEAQVKSRTVELLHAVEIAEEELRQRKLVEEALLESERALRSVLEATNDVAVLLDENLKIVLSNARTASLLNQDRRELVGLSFPEELPSECRKDLLNCLKAGMVNQQPKECELVIDGHTYLIHVYPIAGPQYENFHTAVFMSDVTAQREAERALIASEERFRTVVQSQTEYICRYLADGEITFVNQACSKLFNIPKEEIPGSSIWELIDPMKTEGLKTHLESLNLQTPIASHEVDIYNNGTDALWISWTTVAFFDDDGNVLEYQSVGTDITERILKEKALKSSEQRYLSFFENNPVMMLILDPFDSRILDANKAACNFYGYSKEDFKSLRISDITIFNKKHFSNCFNDDWPPKPSVIQLTHKSKDNEFLDVELFCGKIRIDENEVACCIVQDIRDRLRREQKLLEYQQHLSKLSSELTLAEERERRNLAADLHDNIVQSLTLCDLKLKMAINQSGQDPLNRNLDDVHTLLSDTISNIRALTFDLSPPILYELGLKAAIEWLCENLQSQYGLDITVTESEHIPQIEDDLAVLLFRTVRELLLNIIKHARAEHANVSFLTQKDMLIIRIEDDGVGFEELNPDKLASKGLGLFSIKERLKACDGLINIRSWLGHGSSIDIVIPVEEYTGETHCQLN
jgi:PAS domain S-box-containing protein